MERGPELEDHLDKAALERFGPISICFMHRNRRDAHTGDYRDVITAHCQGREVEPEDLSREKKTELILDSLQEFANDYGLSSEVDDPMDRYEHAEKAYESLQDAYLELSQAGRPGLSARVGTVIESLFVEGASQ